MKVCKYGEIHVVDLGVREFVEGVWAAEVVQLAGLRVDGENVEGVFAWVPAAELVAVQPS
jgi:hypothetical protein